jgi:acyl-CoA-binding protein
MTLEKEFNAAVERTRQLNYRPSNDTLLSLYALYKQATVGDVQGKPPAGNDFKSIAKYNSWKAQKGKSRDKSMKEYIDLVKSLK